MMPLFRCRGAIVGAVGCVALIGGCANPRTESVGAQAPTATRESHDQMGFRRSAPSAQWVSEQYADLPIPKGFKYIPEKSFVFMQESLRRADLSYEGSMSSRDVIRFYQDSMPMSDWEFLRLTGVKMKTLTFFKGNEMVEITVQGHSQRAGLDAGQERVSRLFIKLNPG